MPPHLTFCKNLKSIATILLFPFFLPFSLISGISLAWMLVTPESSFLGIHNDVVPFFMVACLWIGVIAQGVIGVPMSLLFIWVRAPFWRGLIGVVASALALTPFHSHMAEFAPTVVLVFSFISLGVWISIHTFHPDKKSQEQNKACRTNRP